MEDIYLAGVVFFASLAVKDRNNYGPGFMFDLMATVVVMCWPVTLAIAVVALAVEKARSQ